jgi:ribulose-5-phosphate 4-epimerase/fuculose-1-phosphate aldolase
MCEDESHARRESERIGEYAPVTSIDASEFWLLRTRTEGIVHAHVSYLATLACRRHNHAREEIVKAFGVPRPTISRAISALTQRVTDAINECVPAADYLC